MICHPNWDTTEREKRCCCYIQWNKRVASDLIAWGVILAHISWVTWSKVYHLSEPQLPRLVSGVYCWISHQR